MKQAMKTWEGCFEHANTCLQVCRSTQLMSSLFNIIPIVHRASRSNNLQLIILTNLLFCCCFIYRVIVLRAHQLHTDIFFTEFMRNCVCHNDSSPGRYSSTMARRWLNMWIEFTRILHLRDAEASLTNLENIFFQ